MGEGSMYLTDATILSEEGSREVLEEMAQPPEDTPERRRTFAGARMMAAYWRQQEAVADAAPGEEAEYE
jgi:hypothetical protein